MKTEKKTDAFGSKEGTRTFAINAVMLHARAPKTVKEVAEATGTKAVYNHIRTLIHKGFVVKTEDGKYVKKAAKAAANKSSKYASKEEAKAAKNARRREARAAAKAAKAEKNKNVEATSTEVVS